MGSYNRRSNRKSFNSQSKCFQQKWTIFLNDFSPLMSLCDYIDQKIGKRKGNDCKNQLGAAVKIQIKQIFVNRLKILDPPLYFRTHYYLQQISLMGKKLRNRELLTQTDLENDEDEHVYPIADKIESSTIRKKLKQRLSVDKDLKVPMINNFKKRLISRQISDIIAASRFQCPICLELLVNPVVMGCGHAYCYRCLDSNTAYSERCCLCRSQHKEEANVPIKFAQILIEKFLVPYGPDLIRYLCRSTDSAEWIKRRQIVNFKLGLVVDFQDRCNIWRRGVIVNVLNNDQIQIKINIKGVCLFEKVDKKSKRLAPYTFFTRSRYLEDFPPILPEHDPTQHSLSKLQYAAHWDSDSAFAFPEDRNSIQRSQDGQEMEEFQDQALRIFNSEMNEIDSILNI